MLKRGHAFYLYPSLAYARPQNLSCDMMDLGRLFCMAASHSEDFKDSRTGNKHHYNWHNTILLTIPRPALDVFVYTDFSRSIFINIPNILVLTFGMVLKPCLVRGQEKVRPKTCTNHLPPRVQTLYVLTHGLLLMNIGCPDSREWPFAHHSHYDSPVLSPVVFKIIGRGSECFIGLIHESKVLKYPRIAGDNTSIEVESQLLAVLGSYRRIVKSYGLSEHDLLLQYAPNGNHSEYIRTPASPLTKSCVGSNRTLKLSVTYIKKGLFIAISALANSYWMIT